MFGGTIMKILILAGLAFGTAAAAVEQPLITSADYPPQLLKERKEGLSEVELVFGADGRPTRCTMLKSSGVGLQDATVCRTLFRRARAKAREPRVQTFRHHWTAAAQD
jgi:outer membrane biosynthesis protein TonB